MNIDLLIIDKLSTRRSALWWLKPSGVFRESAFSNDIQTSNGVFEIY